MKKPDDHQPSPYSEHTSGGVLPDTHGDAAGTFPPRYVPAPIGAFGQDGRFIPAAMPDLPSWGETKLRQLIQEGGGAFLGQITFSDGQVLTGTIGLDGDSGARIATNGTGPNNRPQIMEIYFPFEHVARILVPRDVPASMPPGVTGGGKIWTPGS